MSDFVPLYRRIMNDIKSRIETGELAAGAELPSTSKLAEQYGQLFELGRPVSPGTVRAAVDRLIEAGVLRGHQGLGVFVAGPVTDSSD